MIPKPYYQDDHVTLYCGDCREILPELGKFDLLLTDPPYGHGDKWQGGTWGAAEMYKDAMKWDAETPSEETIADVLKAATVGIVWGGNYFRLPPSRCWLSWEKSSRMDTLADFELAWTSMDRPCKAKREDRNPDGKRVKTSITLPQSLVDYLETTPNRSSTIEGLIRKSTGFRQFVSNRQEQTK